MLEKRRREKQDKDAEKISAIEQKIENARKRLDEQNKIKSQKAKNVIAKKLGGKASNQDLAEFTDDPEEELAVISQVKSNPFKK